jgi:uncharacterized protein (DUF3084 family)
MAREHQVKAYVNADEAQIINQTADALGVSTSELLRRAAINEILNDELPFRELQEERDRRDQLQDEITALEQRISQKREELDEVETRIDELEDALDDMEDTSVPAAESYSEGLERIAQKVIGDDGRKLSTEATDIRAVATEHDTNPVDVVRDVYAQHPRVSRRDVHSRSGDVRPREWTREYEDYDAALDELVSAAEDDVDKKARQEMIRDVVDAFDDVDRDEVTEDVEDRVGAAA